MNPLATAVWERRPQTTTTIVDAHAHGGPYSLFFIPEPGPAAMVRVMDHCGVSATMFAPNLAIQLDAAAGNDEAAAAAAQFPGRMLGYLTINPWQDPEAELARWTGDRRFVGIKLHPDLHQYPVTGSRYRSVWEFAAAQAFPVLIHTSFSSAYNSMDMIEKLAGAHPDVTFLAGHSGSTPPGFQATIEIAQRHPNVVLEICGSFNHGDELVRAVAEVGADQVAFGSDFPFIDLRFALGRVLFANISEEERAAVLGGTITRLLDRQGRAG
jgi:uncharacterized protein